MTEPEPPSPSLLSNLPAHEVRMARLSALLKLDSTPWWNHAPITRQCVMNRWREGNLEPESYIPGQCKWTRERHLDRIGFFCAYGWREPVVLAIHKDEARVVEGLHRILAARVLGHRVVTAKVMGGNESKRRIFGIRMGKSNLFYPSPTTFGRARPVPFPVDPRTNLSLSGPSLDKENITCQEARTGRLPGS